MDNLIPHGVCLASEPWLVGLLVICNFTIFIAYMAIPFVMFSTWRKISKIPVLSRLSMWFAAFILLCGATHAAAVVTIYFGGVFYIVEALICLATAAVSLVSLSLLWAAVPYIVKR